MANQRTYYSNSVESAVAQARQELGEETLLVDAGPTGEAERHLGAYAVLVESGSDEPETPTGLSRVHEASSSSSAPGGLDAIQSELSRLSILVGSLTAHSPGFGYVPEMNEVAAQLGASGLPHTLIRQILERVERRLGLRHSPEPATESQIRRGIAAELESMLAVSPGLGGDEGRRRVVAFVGPPGAGKTTTLAKLAMRYGIAGRIPSVIVSTDCYRIAASEQLRAYASILGLPFALAETPGALSRVMVEQRQKDLVFIDTPGFGPRDQDFLDEWSSKLNSHSDIQVYLVLPATARCEDLLAAYRRWALFHPTRLIFTHMDETEFHGGWLGLALTTGLPISCLCFGQGVPEDLEVASKPLLLQLLFGGAARAANA
ncbi:GTPase [uncultured Paludibaculum sp.]|uniref:flagellar biosynthesis protein FlhF n=1 Tax=uncultured Paludibaculum sp. TaxID=1765020 RepID=UPI002AABE78A|nr:GTPase [uncultured Paludibaculum sp.]